jgi:glucose/arabinose dehydrogenase
MSPRLPRRRFLHVVGAGAAAAAGCLGGDTDATSDPEPVDSAFDLTVEHDIESWDRYDPDWTSPETSPLGADFAAETVIEGLEIPWDLGFDTDGTCFISERVGRISRYESGDLESVTEPDAVIDHATSIEAGEEGGWWEAGGEGGLLGIALHPNYPDVPVVYAFIPTAPRTRTIGSRISSWAGIAPMNRSSSIRFRATSTTTALD